MSERHTADGRRDGAPPTAASDPAPPPRAAGVTVSGKERCAAVLKAEAGRGETPDSKSPTLGKGENVLHFYPKSGKKVPENHSITTQYARAQC